MKKKSYPSIVYLFLFVCFSTQSFSTDVSFDLNPGGPEGPVLMDLQADQPVTKRQFQDGRSERSLGGKLYAGKMGDLVEADRLSRRAFNRNPELIPVDKLNPNLTLATKVHDILTKRENVSVDRYATPTEKDDILKVIISSVIRDPSTYTSIPVKDANEAKRITDSFDKHVYIVEMAGVFAYELLKKGDIKSTFDVFQEFSSIKRSHFHYLFEQAKNRHRRGLVKIKRKNAPDEIQKAMYTDDLSVPELKDMACGDYSEIAYDALSQLFYRVVAGFEEVRQQAFNVLIELVNNSRYEHREKVLFHVYEIANNANNLLLKGKKGYSKQIRETALNTLNAIADDDKDPRQSYAIWYLFRIAKDPKAVDALLEKLKILANGGSLEALDTLISFASTYKGKKAWKVLKRIAKDDGHMLQQWVLSHIISALKNEEQKKRTLQKIIGFAKDNGHFQQKNAIKNLGYIIHSLEVSDEIRDDARNALDTIVRNVSSSADIIALAKASLNPEAVAAASAAAASVYSEGAVAAAAASVDY